MNTVSLFAPRLANNFLSAFDRDFYNFSEDSKIIRKPLVDVKELEKSYVFEMELPGLDEKDIEINLKDNVLSIASIQEAVRTETSEDSGKDSKKELSKAEKNSENEATWLIRERKSYQFSRSFSLPKDIDENAVHAQFKNGLLTITVNRKEESKAKTIKISA